MKITMRAVVQLFVVSMLLSGCATIDHGEFSVLSLTPIDNNKHYKKVETNAVGTDKAIYWAFYAGKPKLNAAVGDALKKHNGDYMTNVKVRFESWIIPIIYGEFKFEVTGEVWKVDHDHTANESSTK